ncbi:unnamed protein product [Phaeothamnion confervicola]
MVAASQRDVSRVGSAALDWTQLGFEWRDTNAHLTYTCKDGVWGDGEVVRDPYIKVHIANTAMHYGQAAFEGLKAFHMKDGNVRIFRPTENAARIAASARRILMEPPPRELFLEACRRAVRENMEFVPPYGTNGALYIRPLLFGSGPRIGLQPSGEYTLLVMVIPVGEYYKGGMRPTTAVVIDGYDRAAPRGVGGVKVAGNYAADMLPNVEAKRAGYPIGLYLDAKTNSLVEEFSTSNFLGVTRDGRYVTPDSPAILPSITNKASRSRSLMELAMSLGMPVERRAIPMAEVGELAEVAACGTAVVMTAIKQVVWGDSIVPIAGGSDEVGPVCRRLYGMVRAIQTGDAEDALGWMVDI